MLEHHYLTTCLNPSRSPSSALPTERIRSATSSSRTFSILATKDACTRSTPKHDTIQGVQAYKSIEEISARVELAVVVTRPQTVPKIIEQCGRSGVKNAIVITSGFAEAGHSGAALERKMMEIARSYGVRLLGPNCLGIIRPNLGLNATFARVHANVGNLALVSQSGAICSAVLDWATSNRIGFSSVISLGGTADVDFGEILDYLIYDNRTHYILLYVEGIRDARRFMSALRSAARIKPIVLLKAGRHAGGLAAVETHSGMAAGSDVVFDAAVRRAGVVRVKNIGQLFYAAKALASKFRPQGKAPGDHHQRRRTGRHGRRPCRRPRDSARRVVGEAPFRRSTRTMPPTWSQRNPVDIEGDATAQRYHDAILAVAEDGSRRRSGDAVAAGHDEPMEVAKAVIEVDLLTAKPILTCWMGEEQVREGARAARRSRYPLVPHAGNRGRALLPYLHLLLEPEAPAADAGALVEAFAPGNRRRQDVDRGGVARAAQDPLGNGIEGHPARLPHSGRADHGRAHADRIAAAGRTDRFPDRHEDRFAGHHPQERRGRRAAQHHQRAGGSQRLSRHHRNGQEAAPDGAHQRRFDRTLPGAPERSRTDDRRLAGSDFWSDHHFRRRRHRSGGLQRPGGCPATAEPLPGA
jgi:succinyl-CoA synthetase alpha subunit